MKIAEAADDWGWSRRGGCPEKTKLDDGGRTLFFRDDEGQGFGEALLVGEGRGVCKVGKGFDYLH